MEYTICGKNLVTAQLCISDAEVSSELYIYMHIFLLLKIALWSYTR